MEKFAWLFFFANYALLSRLGVADLWCIFLTILSLGLLGLFFALFGLWLFLGIWQFSLVFIAFLLIFLAVITWLSWIWSTRSYQIAGVFRPLGLWPYWSVSNSLMGIRTCRACCHVWWFVILAVLIMLYRLTLLILIVAGGLGLPLGWPVRGSDEVLNSSLHFCYVFTSYCSGVYCLFTSYYRYMVGAGIGFVFPVRFWP